MKKTMNTKLALGMFCSVGLAFGLAGTAQAVLTTQHNNIVLKDAVGTPIPVGGTAAYSVKQTCGTCHNYATIEQHATHAQLGANAISGFNPYNPDSKMLEKTNDTSMGKNWVQSTGHVGKWCPPSARQSARMFGGSNGMSSYSSAMGKFAEINSNNWLPFDYATETAFKQKADLTVASMMQDCGECHVGGGAMEYVPWTVPNMNNRVSLRNIATSPVNGGASITGSNVTTFNYFIDVYDVDGDNDRTEAIYNDYSKTGVAEMDCMMCHLKGYDGEGRTSVIRKAKHDTARAVGAGIATTNAMTWPDGSQPVAGQPAAGYGTTVGTYDVYNATTNPDGKVVDNGSGVLKLTTAFADNIKKQPPSTNCAFCHMGTGFGIGDVGRRVVVDFKKRGDHWTENTNWDVHSGAVECIDCHENKGNAVYVADVQPAGASGVDATTGTSGASYATGDDLVNNTTGVAVPDGLVDSSGVPVNLTGTDSSKLGQCDPSKGPSNFEQVWNAKDVAGLSCVGCHTTGDPKKHPGAPDPAAAHAAAGLSQTRVQSKNNTSGVADASHLDIMECGACHIRKLEHYSGSAIIDATGKDHEGRMTDHENQWTERDMYDNLLTIWYQGKLIKANSAITMFWVDKNDVNRDANNDGRIGGMDPLMTSHIHTVNNANGWKSITDDEDGVIASSEITARQTALSGALDGLLGTTGPAIQPKLVFMGVTFNVDHGTSRAERAWGAGGCKDCHAPNAGFYNGTYEAKPRDLNMTFAADTSQVVPFTMVNSGTQASSYHPAVMLKKEQRSVAVNLTSGQSSLRSPDRSEYLYETTFMKPNTAWDTDGVITGSAITFPSAAANGSDALGWMLKVQVKDDGADDSTAVTYTLQNPTSSTTVTDVATLISAMNGASRANGKLTDGSYGFTVTNGGSSNLVLTASGGKVIRIGSGSSNAAQLGFASALYVADPITGVKGGTYAGRTAWVDYLNGIGVPGAAVITAPALAPPALNAAVAGTAVTFTANTTGHVASSTLYKWDMGNGMVYETEKDANGQPLATYKHNNGTPSNTADDVTGIVGSLATVSYAYPVTGQFTAQLFVMNSNGGGQNSDSAIVAVGSPVATPTWTATWDANGTPALLTDDQMELAGLPADWTKIYVVWDDGTKTNVTTGAGSATANILHAYRLIAQRQVGGTHVFNPTIRVYNGTTLLGTRKVTVTTTP